MSLKDRMQSSFPGSASDDVKYYSYLGGVNILRAIDVDYAYLDKRSGKWVSDNSLIGPITGYDGDASTHEITREKAQQWVAKHHPNLNVSWV